MKLKIPEHLYDSEDLFEMCCFIYLDLKKENGWPYVLFKHHVTNSEE